MEELKDYIQALKISIKETNLKDISDTIIFQESCSFMRGKLAGENRFKSGTKQSSKSFNYKKNSAPDSNKPTIKQINYLRGNTIDFNEDTLTKQEAIKLISKHKESGENTI